MKSFLLTLLLVFASCEPTPKEVPTSKQELLPPISKKQIQAFRPHFRKGIALGLFVSKKDDPEFELSIYKKMIEEIVDIGATDLSIPVRWVQKDIHQSEILRSADITVSDAILIAVIKHAKSLGLRVFLMPFIHLKERSEGKWRGTIAPKNPKEWWDAYRKFVYHYADIASAQNVSTFSIGSELSSMRDPKAWSDIIVNLRKRLPKTELTYSANWDRFETFPHWGKLDMIGISTYPPLSNASKPTLTQLNAGWGGFKHRIRELRRRFPKKKILFTEVGYSASRNAAKIPWAHARKGEEVDEELQALLYASLLETWSKPNYLEGMFIWNWFGTGGPLDNGFSPKGKKAETLLRDWY